jgi:hypothetical protein
MSSRRAIASPGIVIAVLILQVIPLLIFPPDSFSPKTQEWWLPVLLVVMVLAADAELIIRRSDKPWPWYLLSFAQGFNIISRLMMIWPRATVTAGGQTAVNWPYLLLSLAAMLMSAAMLWYTEQPAVRISLIKR